MMLIYPGGSKHMVKPIIEANWPPEWYETFKSSVNCKACLFGQFSEFHYPTIELREHAKAMALLMGLKCEEDVCLDIDTKYPHSLRIYHAN